MKEFLKEFLNLKIKKFMLGFGIFFIACFIFENIGIVLSFGSLLLLIIAYKFNGKFLDHSFVLSILAATLISSLLMIFLVIRNSISADSVSSGPILQLWETYGRYNSWFKVFSFICMIIFPSFILGILSFFGGLFFSRQIDQKLLVIFLCSSALSLGFILTLVVGRYISGIIHEWPRQLLPLAYFNSFGLPALGCYLGARLKAKLISN